MKISTKGRYGLKALVELAAAEGNSRTLGELARAQGVSEAYLERIMGSLRRAGLVESVRGALGGYTLAEGKQDVSVGEILRVLEGSTALLDCVDTHGGTTCNKASECVARPLWKKLQARIDEVLDTTTLRDMVSDYVNR